MYSQSRRKLTQRPATPSYCGNRPHVGGATTIRRRPFFLYKREAESHNFISRVRVGSVSEMAVFKEWEAVRASLGLLLDFDQLLPLTKTRLPANSGNRASEVEHFLELGARVNIARSVGGSIRCLPSGLTSYANFCSLLSRPFTPPTGKSVTSRSATSAPGRTFRNYAGRLMKGCALLWA